jgi:hypothetical protein
MQDKPVTLTGFQADLLPATSRADPVAALVEMERGNLFTLSLGNVQPDDIIVICFAYL